MSGTIGESGRDRTASWLRRAAGASLLGAVAVLVVSGARSGPVRAQTTSTYTIGGVDPATAPAVVGIEGRTFSALRNSLVTPPAEAVIPLVSVTGADTSITITGATTTIDEERFSVVIRGWSDDATSFFDATTDVMLLVDYVSAADADPTIVVALKAPALTLADMLGLDPSSIAGDLSLDTVLLTDGSSAIDLASDPTLSHIARPANLPDAAKDYFADVYGELPTPTVPALTTLDQTVHVTASAGLDALGEVPRDVLSYGAGAKVVLEGTLGVGLDAQSTFDPRVTDWSLGATLPRVSADLPDLLPDFLDADPSARWSINIAFTKDLAAVPPDAGKVTVSAAMDVTTDLFGSTQTFALSAQVAKDVSGPGFSVTLKAAIGGEWPSPFGVSWLEVTTLALEGTISRNADSTVSFKGSVRGVASVAGKTFTVRVAGDFTGKADGKLTFDLSLDDSVSVGELVGLTGFPTDDIPDSVLSPAVGPVALQVVVERSTPGSTTTTVAPTTTAVAPTTSVVPTTTTAPVTTTVPTTTTAPATTTTVPASTTTTVPAGTQTKVSITLTGVISFELPNGRTIGAQVLLSLDSDRNVVGGVRPAGSLTLSTLLPASVDASDFDFALADDAAGSSFGFVVSNQLVVKKLNTYPALVREFYRPLLGRAAGDPQDVDLEIPRGASVLGAFTLPDQIAGVVGTLGAQSKVFASGTLPVFDLADPVAMSLGLRLKTDLLPDFVDQITGKLFVEVTLLGGNQKLSVGMEGAVRLRLPAGLPPEAADPINGAGVPVATFEPVAASFPCANGSTPEKVSDRNEFRCYDLLEFSLRAPLEFSADGVGIAIEARVSTPRPGDIYRPFGLEWLGLDETRIRLGISTMGTNVTIELGFLADVQVRDNDFLGAIQVSVTPMLDAPYIKVELDGIRVASGSGASISDFFDLQHDVARIWAVNNGQPEPPRIDPADLHVPDIAFRNMELSFSPKGVPALCIPQGLVLGGDLYVNPSGSEPVNNPACDNGISVIPDEADQCLSRRLDGCITSGRLKISNAGFLGLFQMAGFSFGPVHLENINVDVALTLAEQHFVLEGGARVDNFFGDEPDPLAGGRLRVQFLPLQMDIFGELSVLGFNALVDASTNLNLLSDPQPDFDLHVLLATDQSSRLGEPTLEGFANGALDGFLLPLRTTAIIADEILLGLEGSPLSTLQRLPGRLRDAGIPVPGEIAAFSSDAAEFLDEFDTVLDVAPGSLFDLVMNGIPSFGFEGEEAPSEDVCLVWVPIKGCVVEETICFGLSVDGGCWFIPPFEFPGAPGLCDPIFPASQFPGLRDSSGDCTRSGVINAVVFPIFDRAISEVLGIDVNVRQLIRDLAMRSGEPMLAFECAEYFLKVSPGEAFTELTFVGRLFGQGLGFQLGFDFLDPLNSVTDLGQDLIRNFLAPGSVACLGYNDDLFGPPVDPSAPRLTIEAPDVADEGSPITLLGSFGVALPEARSVAVQWGDGSTEVVTVAAGGADFEVVHTYVDDDPSGTAADLVQIVATDQSPGGRTSAESLTLRNVAPRDVAITVHAAPVAEAATATFTVTFTDPGADDTHTAIVDWDDGRVSEVAVPAGSRQVAVTHTYRDDNPTATPSDVRAVAVKVVDDDTGTGTVVQPFTVHNVAPANVAVTVTDHSGDGTVEENEPVTIRVAWDDPGLADTHSISVDWGTGTDSVALRPARGARSVTVGHTFGDNGAFTISVVVTDDDTGTGAASATVAVSNVDPQVAFDRAPTFAAPGGDTYMVRTGVSLEVSAGATDPGSDDLTFAWEWGDGLGDVDVDRVNPPGDDPLPSPSRQPRDVVDTKSHTYARACLYWLDLRVTDDDAGPAADRAPVVVVGVDDQWHSHGWWGEEYRHFDRPGDAGQVDDRTLLCHLAVAEHMSSVFGEAVAAATAADANAILFPGGGGGQLQLRQHQLDQALLTAWLNVASGATGTDPSGFLVPGFAAIVYAAEAVRLDPLSTVDGLFAAQLAVEAAIRNFSPGA